MHKQDFEEYARQKKFCYKVPPLWEIKIKDIIKQLNKPVDKIKILDYGCGDGKCFPFFLEAGFSEENIYGLEVSQIRVDRCRSIGWKNTFISISSKLPFENNFFDIVSLMEVIEHIPPKKSASCIEEIVRTTQSQGYVLIATPNYPVKRFYDFYDAFIGGKISRLRDDPTHVNHFNHKKLYRLLSQYFKNVTIHPYKKGFLFEKYTNPLFLHKMLAINSLKSLS
jgi:2-polyprenyl-3-methyl-5-hydroxy-6-metoxy-1,4-benzoquinol methylase